MGAKAAYIYVRGEFIYEANQLEQAVVEVRPRALHQRGISFVIAVRPGV